MAVAAICAKRLPRVVFRGHSGDLETRNWPVDSKEDTTKRTGRFDDLYIGKMLFKQRPQLQAKATGLGRLFSFLGDSLACCVRTNATSSLEPGGIATQQLSYVTPRLAPRGCRGWLRISLQAAKGLTLDTTTGRHVSAITCSGFDSSCFPRHP